jgi:hypothetical protein
MVEWHLGFQIELLAELLCWTQEEQAIRRCRAALLQIFFLDIAQSRLLLFRKHLQATFLPFSSIITLHHPVHLGIFIAELSIALSAN